MNISQNLQNLRNLMKVHDLSAFIIVSGDPHLSEYVPDHYRQIAWFSGFTGSAATVVVTPDFAGLWTDSRYFLQAEIQLQGTEIKLVKLKIAHTPEYINWLVENLSAGQKIGTDGSLISAELVQSAQKSFAVKHLSLLTNLNLIDQIWENRPPLPTQPIFVHELKFAGITRLQKIAAVRNVMVIHQAKYHLLTTLDDIAWLLNFRGTDINFNPVALSFVLITPSEVFLFIDDLKVNQDLKAEFEQENIYLKPVQNIYSELTNLPPDCSIILSIKKINNKIINCLPPDVKIIDAINPSTQLKACKNEIEIENIKQSMIKDGVALAKCFHWIEINISKQAVTELTVVEKLIEYRKLDPDCVGPSFGSIVGYKDHGAIVHYEPGADTDVQLYPDGLLLIDSGGQYFSGTTDITRVLALGAPTAEEIRDYTLVLKGMIGLSMVKFPYGTKGYQFEILARKPLWDNGLNYGHGTGHGVGYFLNVHEGPQTIGTGASGTANLNFEKGMLTSVEPGLYREGKYGIRCENLILSVSDSFTEYGEFLGFETLTLCHFESSLIDVSMLNYNELTWLKEYHQKVFEKISPFLTEIEKDWLRNKCGM